jgi:hypothetical protein
MLCCRKCSSASSSVSWKTWRLATHVDSCSLFCMQNDCK